MGDFSSRLRTAFLAVGSSLLLSSTQAALNPKNPAAKTDTQRLETAFTNAAGQLQERSIAQCDRSLDGNAQKGEMTNDRIRDIALMSTILPALPEQPQPLANQARAATAMADLYGFVFCMDQRLATNGLSFVIHYRDRVIALNPRPEAGLSRLMASQMGFHRALLKTAEMTGGFNAPPEKVDGVPQKFFTSLPMAYYQITEPKLATSRDVIRAVAIPPVKGGQIDLDVQKRLDLYQISYPPSPQILPKY